MAGQKLVKASSPMFGWRMHEALVTTLGAVVLSLMLVLAWEGTRPLLLVVTPGSQLVSTLEWHLGELTLESDWRGNIVWNASESLALPDANGNWNPRDQVSDFKDTDDAAIDMLERELIAKNKPFLASNSEHERSAGFHSGESSKVHETTEIGVHSVSGLASHTNLKQRHASSPRTVALTNDHSQVDNAIIAHDRANLISVQGSSSSQTWTPDIDMNSGKEIVTESIIQQIEKKPKSLNGLNVKKSDVLAEPTCDYSRGFWVKDNSRSLYSGKHCKQYLSPMWACRLNKRPDFDFEKLRWQPEDCELPKFSSSRFLLMMTNKVIAFVGDSLGRQQFQSLMCMLTGGKDVPVVDVGAQYDLNTRGSLRPKGWAYRFKATNTTIIFFWSATLCDIDSKSDSNGYDALNLDRPVSFLARNFENLDLVVLNTGHHWNRGKFEQNKWRMHVGGKPVDGKTKLAGIAEAHSFAVQRVVKWVDEKISSSEAGIKPTVFMRSLSPRHFKNGEWNSGGRCDTLRPEIGKNVTVKGLSKDQIAENAVHGTHVHLLNITYISQFREEAHVSKYGKPSKDGVEFFDCLHWCLPGVPDVWNEILYGFVAGDGTSRSMQPKQSERSNGHAQ